MKTVIFCLLCCLSVLAADTNEIRLVKWTDDRVSPGYLVTYEEFTRSGQTNLLRVTTSQNGVTSSTAHNFYHRGAYLGRYSKASGCTFVNAAPGAPVMLTFVWDSSNQLKTASVSATNYVILDSFTYTNGLFYPAGSSEIEESNRKTKGILPR